MTALVIPFAAPDCRNPAIAGGKGANLAILSADNLPVPPGFCVTTRAYHEFAESIGLAAQVEAHLTAASASVDVLETRTAELRARITAAPLPEALAAEILKAYAELEPGCYVAVRSSGTAEDLAGASFAGLHDTYLDIRGTDVLLDAIKSCWASMWTARATSYRQSKGFGQARAEIAVVVQMMVESDVAGVMFTANPLTTATDEIVINAAYGLGEALVSGIATPDEHILARETLALIEQRIGAKEVRIVRDPARESGTVTQPVPIEQQQVFALSAAQLRGLGELGRNIMTLYGGLPQEIEWAIAADKIYLLQARPITGAAFSWDTDLEEWQKIADDPNSLWTRSWADELWNGGISPLTYSYRGPMFTIPAENMVRLCGLREGLPKRMYKYWKGEVYFNTDAEQYLIERTALPAFRPALLQHTPPEARESILKYPLSIFQYLKMHANMLRLGYGPYQWLRVADNYLNHRVAEANGKTTSQLRDLTDAELKFEFEHFAWLKTKFSIDLYTGFFIYARDSTTLLAVLLANWYTGANPAIFAEIMSGLPKRTSTAQENFDIFRLADRIRNSPALLAAFNQAGVNYQEKFAEFPEGAAFLKDYRAFVQTHGHRGHADRDMFYTRRSEDPAIDFETLRLLLSGSAADPQAREHQVNARRNAAIADVEANLRAKSFGWCRIFAFRRLLHYVQRFYLIRDDQRYYFDRYTFAMKRLALEIGRRLAERGIFARADDVFFLGRYELYPVLEGAPFTPLLRAKLAARRHNFALMLAKQANPPAYLRRNREVDFTQNDPAADKNTLRGTGTARGSTTARARIVKDLRDIGQISEGDILITNSTDPGWTPVFNLLKGIVLETGGMLAHGSCLAREYGLPAVQLAGATRLIPDGATITVNGDTGSILIHEPELETPTAVDDDSASAAVGIARGGRRREGSIRAER